MLWQPPAQLVIIIISLHCSWRLKHLNLTSLTPLLNDSHVPAKAGLLLVRGAILALTNIRRAYWRDDIRRAHCTLNSVLCCLIQRAILIYSYIPKPTASVFLVMIYLLTYLPTQTHILTNACFALGSLLDRQWSPHTHVNDCRPKGVL